MNLFPIGISMTPKRTPPCMIQCIQCFPFFFFVLPVNSIVMRPLPRLLRYAPKAREGTLKLHFYLESIRIFCDNLSGHRGQVSVPNYWCPLKIFGDFRDFYFLGQPIYWTHKQSFGCCKGTEYASKQQIQPFTVRFMSCERRNFQRTAVVTS